MRDDARAHEGLWRKPFCACIHRPHARALSPACIMPWLLPCTLPCLQGRVLTAVSARPPPASLHQPVIDFVRALAPITPGWRGQLFRLGAAPALIRACKHMARGGLQAAWDGV